jgi:lipopolysaccharide transport system permease protein
MIQDLWNHRRYIVVNGINGLLGRYQGTILGWAWVFLPPLALIAIYTVIFSKVMPVQRVGTGPLAVAYVLYLTSGLLPWMAFSEFLVRGSQALLEASPYLKKMPIKEVVFVAQSSISVLIILGIYLLLMCLVSLLFGHFPHPTWLLLVPIAILLGAMGFGLACILAVLNLFFRDVEQALGIILQIWLWMVPVIYLETVVPQSFRYLFWVNPIYPFLVGFREAFLYYNFPGIIFWGAMIGWAVFFSQLGMGLLYVMRGEIRDAL